MTVWRRLLLAGCVSVLAVSSFVGAQAPRSNLLLVIDGLRPDYVTPEIMPRLYALGQRGIVFEAHHSVFPTVTRVNASSISTGSYPETHGLMGNTIYSEKTFPGKGLDTSEQPQLAAMEKAEGQLLTAPTLGEALDRAGKKMLVISAGSTGSAFLLNHQLRNGAVIHPELFQPESLKSRITAALGAGPEEAVPNNRRNKWIVDLYLSLGLNELKSDVTAMWFGDPDLDGAREGHRHAGDQAGARLRGCGDRPHRRHASPTRLARPHEHPGGVRPRLLDSFERVEAGRSGGAVRQAAV